MTGAPAGVKFENNRAICRYGRTGSPPSMNLSITVHSFSLHHILTRAVPSPRNASTHDALHTPPLCPPPQTRKHSSKHCLSQPGLRNAGKLYGISQSLDHAACPHPSPRRKGLARKELQIPTTRTLESVQRPTAPTLRRVCTDEVELCRWCMVSPLPLASKCPQSRVRFRPRSSLISEIQVDARFDADVASITSSIDVATLGLRRGESVWLLRGAQHVWEADSSRGLGRDGRHGETGLSATGPSICSTLTHPSRIRDFFIWIGSSEMGHSW